MRSRAKEKTLKEKKVGPYHEKKGLRRTVGQERGLGGEHLRARGVADLQGGADIVKGKSYG